MFFSHSGLRDSSLISQLTANLIQKSELISIISEENKIRKTRKIPKKLKNLFLSKNNNKINHKKYLKLKISRQDMSIA